MQRDSSHNCLGGVRYLKHGLEWWMWINMKLSDAPLVGRCFAWLAGLPLGPHKARWPLASITEKPYVSPKAQVCSSGVHIGPQCFIDDFVTMVSRETGGGLVLDREVYIYRGTILEVGQGSQITVGQGTHIQANCVLNAFLSDIRIGRGVTISPYCGLFSYQHQVSDLSKPMCRQPLTSKGAIVVEDHVRLGMGVKVMDGVHIGQGAIVEAGAVVTGDVPPRCLAAGVPARVVDKRDKSRPDKKAVR